MLITDKSIITAAYAGEINDLIIPVVHNATSVKEFASSDCPYAFSGNREEVVSSFPKFNFVFSYADGPRGEVPKRDGDIYSEPYQIAGNTLRHTLFFTSNYGGFNGVEEFSKIYFENALSQYRSLPYYSSLKPGFLIPEPSSSGFTSIDLDYFVQVFKEANIYLS